MLKIASLIQRQKIVIAICIMACLCSCQPFIFFQSWSTTGLTHLERADRYVRDSKYDDAISEYRQHIDYRLHTANRPEWENPHFYLLMIGDLQIRQEKFEDALKSYERAESEGVDKLLVSDRFRFVARVFEQQAKHKQALEILQRYRNRDPLLFDSTLDRIAKELTWQEEREALKKLQQ